VGVFLGSLTRMDLVHGVTLGVGVLFFYFSRSEHTNTRRCRRPTGGGGGMWGVLFSMEVKGRGICGLWVIFWAH
jgi:hypothetical protein